MKTSSHRDNNIRRLREEPFDVLIIGSGINGAVCAAALAAQGAHVALIDRGDFASETSQESSNLVWGGIKYLETLEFGLVNKLCGCRNELLDRYPANVREIRFFTTIERGFRWPRLFLYAGTWLYWLIGRGRTSRPRLLSKDIIRREEPYINTSNSPGGFEYSDAYVADNDTRFVFGFVRGAIDHGCVAANYVGATAARRDADGTWHTTVSDTESDAAPFEIRSKAIINACGPWVDQFNSLAGIQTTHRHVLSKGVHLTVPRVTRHRRTLTFFAEDGRLFFVIPMGVVSCVGTTDTRVDSPDVTVTDADRDFILKNVNSLLRLPKPLTRDDVVAERCGVRPLVIKRSNDKSGTRDWTALSRKHAVEFDASRGFVSVFGGKITDCLNVGREVVACMRKLGIDLPYPNARWYGEPDDKTREEFFLQARLLGLDSMTAKESSEALTTRLWRRYGWRAFSLLEDIRHDPTMADVLIKGTEYIRCELHHAARHEMVVKLEDFLRRRSKIALVERRETILEAPGLMDACRILFGDDAERRVKEYDSIPHS